jgi:chromosome segregation ATPase
MLQLLDAKAPLKQRMHSKELDKKRIRSAASQELKRLQDIVNEFQNDVRHLQEMNAMITQYTSSNKQQETSMLELKVSAILKEIEEQKSLADKLRDELTTLATTLSDQERQRKQIEMNLDLLSSESCISDLEMEVQRLASRRSSVEGYDTAGESYELAKKRSERLGAQKARVEGRWIEVVERIRSLKVSFCVVS